MPRSGTGRVYQRGKTWWIDYGFRGKRYRESSGSRKKKNAVALLRKRLAEMGAGDFVGPSAEQVTFADLAEGIRNHYRIKKLKTAERMKLSVRHLQKFFGADARALDITDDRVTAYAIHRQEEGAAQATIQRELMALSKMFKLGRKKLGGYRPEIPSLNVSNVRKGFLDEAEIEAVIRELTPPVRPLVRFAALTGWRKGEILGLRWSQVDFDAGVIRLDPGTTKNLEGRLFPFHELPPLARLLEAQRQQTRKVEKETGAIVTHVFHRNGEPIRSIRTGWNAACRRAGLEGALFHDLRRTAVRNLVRAGVPEKTAMQLVGHKTRSIFDRYNITNEADARAGVAKLAELHEGTAKGDRSVVPIGEASA